MDIVTAAMIIPGGALLGIIILACLQYHLRQNSLPYINSRYLKFLARKYASDRPLHRYLRNIGIATPLYLAGLLSILAINTTVLATSKTQAVLIKRSGEAFLINLILLLVCGRPNVLSDRVHVSQQFKNFIHRWLSIVDIVECAVHLTSASSLIRSGKRPFTSASSIAGLIAAISIAFLGVFSLPFVQSYAYELFLSTHIALTAIISVALFLHLAPFDFSQPSVILLIIASSLYAILVVARTGISLWNRAEIRVSEENGLLKADITLAKPRRVRAGLYVFLRVPSTSAPSINQSHPFYIASWDQDEGGKAKKITALIQRRKGFTRLLRAQATGVRAFLEGPYGESPLAENYGNVILFASGIGITAHLGCIKQLLNARDQGGTKTQVISLLWEVDEVEPWNAAIKMVHELLDQDADRCDRERPDWKNARNRFIFKYTMFVRRHQIDSPNKSSESLRGRQRWFSGALNAASTLKQELNQRLTRTLISVCANREMTDIIQSAYASTLKEAGKEEAGKEEAGKEEVILHTHDFCPDT